MSLLKTFYIFRHGQTDWNLERRIQGHTDVPLNETGIEQAKSIFPKIKNKKLDIIYSSDLSRAKQTAEIVANNMQLNIEIEPRLREACFGEAEGMLFDDIIERFGEDLWSKFKSYTPEFSEAKFPGGETRGASAKRMQKVIFEIIENTDYQTIGISTHGGVVFNLLHSLLPEGKAPTEIPNCVVFELIYEKDKEWKVKGPL